MIAFLVPIGTTLLLVVTAVILFFKNAYSYWDKRGVPICSPKLLGGNINGVLFGTKSLGQSVTDCYDYFKSKGYKHGGIYFVSYPVYMPLDLDTIKNVLIKDFQYFMDHGAYFDEVNEPITAHLFSLEGTKWKNLRNKLSPTFTSGKMKMMFPIVVDCSNQLRDVCKDHIKQNIPINIKDVIGRFNTDVIGACAFGIDTNSLKSPQVSEFRKMGKKFFEPTTWDGIKFNLAFAFPGLFKKLGLKMLNEEMSDFFLKTVKETIEYREVNDVKRNDFLQLLIQLKNKGQVEDENGDVIDNGKITMNEACAQAFVFFLGGSDTSATAMSFCLMELALHPDIQEKLRKEVMTVMEDYDGQITYEGIQRMKYMDMVLNETLRRYPPVMMLMRVCRKDYQIPGTDLVIQKGHKVCIPVKGMHLDPEYYPDPEKFDPERFSEENKTNRHVSLWLPFGEGPRICIGMRFGVMQMKVALATLLTNYKFTMSPKTTFPLVFNPQSIVLMPLNDIWLNIENL